MISDCGINLQKYISATGALKAGDIFSDIESVYGIRVNRIVYPDGAWGHADIEVLKDNQVIATATYTGQGGYGNFDNNQLCIAVNWFDVSSSNPNNYFVDFRMWWNPPLKELVTNVNIPAELMPLVGDMSTRYTGSRYTEGNNYVYVFERSSPVNESSAAASLGRFLSSAGGKVVIVALILGLSGIAVTWIWRDAGTKKTEATTQISKDTQDQINDYVDLLRAGKISPEQFDELVKKTLDNEAEKLKNIRGTDWESVAMIAAAGLVAFGLLSVISKR